ncbi:MAG: TrmH family RNA methyltransferase [Kiritimatiellia bacterium]
MLCYPILMDVDSEKPWRDVYKQLCALEAQWEKPRFRLAAINALQTFFLTHCASVPHLGALVRLVRPTMTRQDLFSLLVPCERVLHRVKITDTEILTHDLSADQLPAIALPLTVIVDNFRSAMNVGSLFRASDCFGISEVILCGYTPAPDDGRAKIAALGTEAWVPWSRTEHTVDAVRAAQQRGIQVVALETVAHAPTLETWQWTFPCAVVVGSERFGLDAAVVNACDACLRIPLYGRKNSLNVVMAFTLAAHAARQAFNQE